MTDNTWNTISTEAAEPGDEVLTLRDDQLIRVPVSSLASDASAEAARAIAAETALDKRIRPVSTLRYGLVAHGDSFTWGLGTTTPEKSYVGVMSADYATAIVNHGEVGNTLVDMQAKVFGTLAPADSGNPIVTMFVGANDVTWIYNSDYATSYKAIYAATAAYAAIPAPWFLSGAHPDNLLNGAWSDDATYARIAGKRTTENGATYTVNFFSPSGAVYLLYASNPSSGGTFEVTLNSTPASDQITGARVMHARPPLAFLTSTGKTQAVAAERFIVPANVLMTLQVTVTSPSGEDNPVAIYGVAVPPGAPKARGLSAPRVYLAGAIRQPYDTNAVATAYLDATNKAVADMLYGDGLNVHFVDVRSYLNPSIDMQNVDWMGIAPVYPLEVYGHPNDSGHRHIAAAFEDAINAVPAAQIADIDAAISGAFSIAGASDVEITSPQPGDLLKFGAGSKWVNDPIIDGGNF